MFNLSVISKIDIFRVIELATKFIKLLTGLKKDKKMISYDLALKMEILAAYPVYSSLNLEVSRPRLPRDSQL